MSRRRAALANVAGMTTNTVVVALQALLLIPLYLEKLGPRLYGAWLGSGDILNFLQLFDLGLTQLVTQRIGSAHAREDSREVGEYFGSAILALTVIGAVLAGLALLLSLVVARVVHVEGAEARTLTSCFRLGALATFFFVANFSVLGLARGTQETTLQNIGTVAGSIVGMVVSVVMLMRGAGLWAIVSGMCARTGVALAVSILFVLLERHHGRLRDVRVTRRALRDFATTSPATTLSGIGYLLTTQTDATLVAALIGPAVVPVLMLTRRAIDVASGILNALAYSSFSGFAHLVDSPQRSRALEVHVEVNTLWLSLAIAASAAYVVVNPSLVPLWTHSDVFGGRWLTLLLAAQMIVVGRAQVMYYLYRAAGAIIPGSMLQFYESMARVALTVVLLLTVGIMAPAISAVIIAFPVSVLVARRTRALLAPFADPAPSTSSRVTILRLFVCLLAAAGCWFFTNPTWPFVLGVGGTIAILATVVLVVCDPRLARLADPVLQRMFLSRVKPAGAQPPPSQPISRD